MALPDTITMEDGVSAKVGDVVWCYYDMNEVKIAYIMSNGWFDTSIEGPDNQFETRGPLLNGQRVCSLETARRKGWLT
jgi:hypothetical protein